MMIPYKRFPRIQDLPIKPTSRSRPSITNPHRLLDIADFFVISLLSLIHNVLTPTYDPITTHIPSRLLMTHFPMISPFVKHFPFWLVHYQSPSVYFYTLLVCAHEPALYPLVYIPRLGYDVLPRFDITEYSEVTT